MSNYLAIATVTAALSSILQTGIDGMPSTDPNNPNVQPVIAGARVTTQRPEKISNGNQNSAGINLFLYQITANAGWRNADIVVRRTPTANRADDIVEQSPQVPFNLHYMLSFYGDDQRLEPQRLLGSAISLLHAQPYLTPDLIRSAIQNNSILNGSNLDFQAQYIEHVKLSPLELSLEELSKVWSVFYQVPYVLSIAYEVSVVLIEPLSPAAIKVVREPIIKGTRPGSTGPDTLIPPTS